MTSCKQHHPARLLATLTRFWSMLLVCLLLLPATAPAATRPDDRHYTDVGFFDIHVCNWPDRPPFLMPLLSSSRYNDIEEVDVHYPDGRHLARFNLSRFRILETKDKPDKRVFMNQIKLPDDAVEGWYSATITLKNGDRYQASDYIVLSTLARVTEQNPKHDAALPSPPKKLSWKPVAGAGFYQVFIRDKWEDNRLIYTSKLLSSPELVLPDGLIEDGGYYSWVVHARDINEDPLLGDFNSGSLSSQATFSVDSSE